MEERRVTIWLAPDEHNVRKARRWLSEVLDRWGRPEAREIAALLLGELVANVVRHVASACEVWAEVEPTRIRVSVHDDSPIMATPRPLASHDLSGRGLVLVDSLSSRWGYHRIGNGKSVWFELDEVEASFSPT